MEINSSLENVSVELGYTGVETSDYKKEADAGKTFCMIAEDRERRQQGDFGLGESEAD